MRCLLEFPDGLDVISDTYVEICLLLPQEKLESIQSAMSIIDFSKISPGTSPSSSSSY